ncbi:BICD family-like cargo adapter 1 isoform X2 [Electrophorus electricus]|uniref:BICD family-like cargo adapter 1 isoform X2 n=1 Tax=Electrophorus electricus TaxID=8005 RepID=UPI0015D095F5|nr:BICD family-like cargo adapter 1 isoform X2 [Electrophorus electricus]
MSRVDELYFKSREMELQEDYYSYEFDSEELPAYQDGNELIAAIRQNEEELILAAQLGNALLLENRQLKEERSKLHEQYADKIEVLEQDRHILQLKLQGCQVQWESQEGELERDVRELSTQVKVLTKALTEAEREKNRSERQHSKLSQHLRQQLNTAMEVERALTADLQHLQQELRDRGHSRPQDEELLSALKDQVARLTQRERDLAQRLAAVCEENAALRDSVSLLHTRFSLQEQQCHTQTQQLVESQGEVAVARSKVKDLQFQMEELQEMTLLQRSGHGDTSLLSEMQRSLDIMGWSQDKEQVRQEVSSILDMLLPVSHGADAPQNQENSLQVMLGHLRNVAERIMYNQTIKDLKQPTVGGGSGPHDNMAQMQELWDQNTRLIEENTELRLKANSTLDEEIVQRAIKDRDDAIAKYVLEPFIHV